MRLRLRMLAKLVLLSGLFMTAPAYAMVIVDQLSVATTAGIVSTASDFSTPFQIADGFTVAAGQRVQITQAEWVGGKSAYIFALGGSQLEFSVRIFQLKDGLVESTPIADVDVTGRFTEAPTSNASQSLYAADINPPITLPGEGTYFLSVVANTPDTTRDWVWFFLDGPTMSYHRYADGEQWTERLPRSYSFRLSGDLLPEAATLLEELHAAVIGVGSGKSLARKIELAQTYYAVPDVQSTCAVLTDFVGQVTSWSTGKNLKIGTDAAATLIADTDAIMDAIGCD